jgi:hypothetical protein
MHRLLICVCLAAAPAATSRAQCDPVEVAKLLAADGGPEDRFGGSVAISDDTIVVGASMHKALGIRSGAAYVFRRVDGAWVQVAKLLASDGGPGDLFGDAVALDADTVAIGAPYDNSPTIDAGSAYVFRELNGVWTQIAKLTASDQAFDDGFGSAVRINSGTVVVGAHRDDDFGEESGSVYVFRESGGSWVQITKLLPCFPGKGDQFGNDVDISGSMILVGSPYDKTIAELAGAVTFFQETDGAWGLLGMVIPPGGAQGDLFGGSVSIDGDTAVILATGDDDAGSAAGAAHVYRNVDGRWARIAILTSGDPQTNEWYGGNVRISDRTIVVGATGNDDLGPSSGSAYVFREVNGVWIQASKLLASDGAAGDFFGAGVSVSGDRAVIGARFRDDLGPESGAAYVFDLQCTPTCPADCNADGVVNIFDFLCFQGLVTTGDPAADCNGDGSVNIFDFLCFQGLVTEGCA